MSQIGINCTIVPQQVDARALWDACCKFVTAQCLLDGISQTEYGIALRNIYPSMDFDMKPEADSWKVIYPKINAGSDYDMKIWDVGWRGNNRDRSVVAIYGVCNLALLKPNCYATRMSFKIGEVKTIEIVPLDQFENGIELLSTPVLYKKNDSIRIDVHVNEEASEKIDWIKLVGVVGEPIGNWVAGQSAP